MYSNSSVSGDFDTFFVSFQQKPFSLLTLVKHSFRDKTLFKGQLISECLLGVIDFPKNQQKIIQISALETKK
jgi:hypothetical protein